ncbi:MAG: ATP-binding protein [Chloroflexi bacterium]|nr:ATP-binding protein [Chloroflexota bacterium]
MVLSVSRNDAVPGTFVVIVSGMPCTGKTTLARRVAEQFSLPLMSKDMCKELLFDTLGWKDREWSKRLGYVSSELLFQFLETQLIAHCSCIVESNFKIEFDTARFLDIKNRYGFEPVQIQCVADGHVLVDRFRQRSESGERHPGHCDRSNYDEFQEMLMLGQTPPLDIGGSFVEVDTTDLKIVDYAAVFAEIDRIFAR